MNENLPPLTPDLRERLTQALDRIITAETMDSISHVDLDPNGSYAVAEFMIFDGVNRRKSERRLWPCSSCPSLPPNIRRWGVRKFYAAVSSNGATIDSAGQEFVCVADWFESLERLGDELPDFEHTYIGPDVD